MSDETALLQAIAANPDEDTPRLAYADWLDEHDAPIQAEFIRTQCRLAAGSAADPDYPDLLERHAELVARFRPMAKVAAPPLPPGFMRLSHVENGIDHFRRGFLHTASGEWSEIPYYHRPRPMDEQLEQLCAGLAPLVANTTVRDLVLDSMTPELLARVLVAPGAERLTGLTVRGYDVADGDALVRTVAGAKSMVRLERLELVTHVTTGVLRAIDAKFDRLRSFAFPTLYGSASEIPALAQATWFRNLRDVRVMAGNDALQEPLLAAFAGLQHLESLNMRFNGLYALKALGTANGFPALTKVEFWWPASEKAITNFVRGRFPRLTDVALRDLRDSQFVPLLAAKWLPQVRALDLTGSYLTDKSAVALSKSAAAPNLRVLRLGYNRLAKRGLTALTNGDRFPNLTTLELRVGYSQTRSATLERIAAELSLPRVRHLDLSGWQFGDAGAKALAANPALRTVTRLSLHGCGIGDRGFAALVRSPHLQQLVELDVGNNTLKKAAALLDGARLPKLAALGLYGNPITGAAREELHRARGWLV